MEEIGKIDGNPSNLNKVSLDIKNEILKAIYSNCKEIISHKKGPST